MNERMGRRILGEERREYRQEGGREEEGKGREEKGDRSEEEKSIV